MTVLARTSSDLTDSQSVRVRGCCETVAPGGGVGAEESPLLEAVTEQRLVKIVEKKSKMNPRISENSSVRKV
jgi:hypothetical protein